MRIEQLRFHCAAALTGSGGESNVSGWKIYGLWNGRCQCQGRVKVMRKWTRFQKYLNKEDTLVCNDSNKTGCGSSQWMISAVKSGKSLFSCPGIRTVKHICFLSIYVTCTFHNFCHLTYSVTDSVKTELFDSNVAIFIVLKEWHFSCMCMFLMSTDWNSQEVECNLCTDYTISVHRGDNLCWL